MTTIRFRPGRFDPSIRRVEMVPIVVSRRPDDTIVLLEDPPRPEPEPLPVVDPATLPLPMTRDLHDEVVLVTMTPDAAPVWAWQVTEIYQRVDQPAISTVRHVPDSNEPLEYDELVILDPFALTPDPAAVPLWRNVVDQVVVLQSVTVQAAQSAIGSAQAAGAASADAASQATAAAAVARRIETTSVTWNPPSIAAGGYTSALVDWAETEFGQMVGIGPMTDLGNGLQIYGVVQTAGRVRLTIRNLTGSAVDLPATTFRLYRIQVPAA